MIGVMIVDHDLRGVEINAAHVAKVAGFRVVARAHSVAEALTRLPPRTPDLLLPACRLPDGDGLAVVEEVRRLGLRTEAPHDVATAEAICHGTFPYLVTPFPFAVLRGALEAYAALRRAPDGGRKTEQSEVDRMFGALSAPSVPTLPTGHSPATAEKVRQALLGAEGPLSARQIAEHAGLSRQTAQRYLKLLEGAGRVRPTRRYGATGRPEHRYAWASRG